MNKRQETDQPNEMMHVDDEFSRVVNFEQVIDSSQWYEPSSYYQVMPRRTRQIVERVVANDEKLRQELRKDALPKIVERDNFIIWEKADPEYIELIKGKQLFTGRVAAVDGTLAKYETLSLIGAQIAVTRTSYQGSTAQVVSDMAYWGREIPNNPSIDDLVASLRDRGKTPKKKLSNLFLNAVMIYKEREILLASPPEIFKLIQGSIFPHEMLTGVGQSHLLATCLNLIARLIEDGNYAAIVSNTSDRDLRMLGYALDAGEYLIARRGTDLLNEFLKGANYTNTPIPQYGNRSQIQLFEDFRDSFGERVVQGVLRAHRLSAPYVFYCNRDNIHRAVHTLLADASNNGPRGFPLLIDIADQYCSGAFRAGEYTTYMNAEFSHASGGSIAYQSERAGRD